MSFELIFKQYYLLFYLNSPVKFLANNYMNLKNSYNYFIHYHYKAINFSDLIKIFLFMWWNGCYKIKYYTVS